MLDSKELLNKIVGARIRNIRDERELTQKDVVEGDSLDDDYSDIMGDVYCEISILSKIENGSATTANPNLISKNYMKMLAYRLKKSPCELVWGTKEEKLDFIKMIVLGVLLNSANNPFCNNSVPEWVEKQENAATLKADMVMTQKTYGYFINPENYLLFDKLNPTFDKEYEQISRLILKLLLTDLKFSMKVTSNLACDRNIVHKNKGKEIIKLRRVIADCIEDKVYYSNAILGYDGAGYQQFVLTFNRYWDAVQEKYLEFFEKHLFSCTRRCSYKKDCKCTCKSQGKCVLNCELLNYGMIRISNKRISEVVTSPEFIKLNEDLLKSPEYANPESLMARQNPYTALTAKADLLQLEVDEPDDGTPYWEDPVKEDDWLKNNFSS